MIKALIKWSRFYQKHLVYISYLSQLLLYSTCYVENKIDIQDEVVILFNTKDDVLAAIDSPINCET